MKASIIILLLGSTSARAQFEGLKNVLSALSSDYEQAPYRILKEFDVRNRKLCRKSLNLQAGYEMRQYPRVNWACTEATYKLGKEPENNMFMKLFR